MRPRFGHILLAASCAAMMWPAAAQEVSPPTPPGQPDMWGAPDNLERLRGDELLGHFEGVTRHGVYKLPTQRSSTQYFSETHHPNGRTEYTEGEYSSDGVWYIINDQVCYRYEDNPSFAHCFYEFKSGNCLYGYAEVTPDGNAPLFPNGWNAKTTADKSYGYCDDLVV